MNHLFLVAGGLSALAGHCVAATVTVTTNTDPSGSNTCPATCSLRQAIAFANANDTITFAPDLVSPIALSQGELLVDKALTITGPGAAKLTISAQNTGRVLNVDSSQLTLSAVTLADGTVHGSAGSYGAVFGGKGGPGGPAFGGCVMVATSATLVLDHAAVRYCRANGGKGGDGAFGQDGYYDNYLFECIPGGSGGNGGAGGNASGGAILARGALTITSSSIVDSRATGGAGGSGGLGGGPGSNCPYSNSGPDGADGPGGPAFGGAIFVDTTASLHVVNSTISGGSANGAGDFPFVGDAKGGAIFSSGTRADIEFSTLTGNQVNSDFSFYNSGLAIFATTATTVLSSVLVDAQLNVYPSVNLCDGPVAAAVGSVNLSEDTSCSGFTLHDTFAHTFVPLNVNVTPWPGFIPLLNGPAHDSAVTCKDISSVAVTTDQHDRPRPQGAKCDLGAMEWQPLDDDPIFADGFGG